MTTTLALTLLASAGLSVSAGLNVSTPTFRSAKPVWPEGREHERNLSVAFRAIVDRPETGPVILRLTGSSVYRISVNGTFAGHGPARGPHGYFRIDELDLTNALKPGKNIIAIEVAGYNANSFYLLDQPSFLQAELVAGDRVLAATGSDPDFAAAIIQERVQKVQRYSFQRPSSEAYRLTPSYDRWKNDSAAPFTAVKCAEVSAGGYLPRRVGYSTFAVQPAVWQVSSGTIQTGIEPKELWRDRSLVDIGDRLYGYPESELEVVPSIALQKIRSVPGERIDQPLPFDRVIKLSSNSYTIVDFGTNRTGFLGVTIRCDQKTQLFLTFDEILHKDDVDFKRLSCVNIIQLDLAPGSYRFESFEPYTMRYCKPIVLEGSCSIEGFYLREYVNPDVNQAQFAASDVRLNRLFEAGRETFQQNATDIFMDCPSRERAGWLCDSFFTARVAKDLMGSTVIEKNFLENYLLPPRFAHLPEGMLPMCYPADHLDGAFIPNWAMWFVVELEEYLARSNDREMVDALRPRVMQLIAYFKPFENSDGLLEKLENWVFVEWSEANKFTQDVNYPSNMLYAGMLSAAGRIYNDPQLIAKADRVRETIRKQSFDGEFFIDNALRKDDGKLEVTKNRSETCQYYAFFFDVATPELHGELLKRLLTDFGPQRKNTKKFPEIHPSNSFIGNVLRVEILSQQGLGQQILNETIDYLLYMADRTGTLWEHDNPGASCNHGFASHICHTLYRDILGVYNVDPVNKRIDLRFNDISQLKWCEGRIPLPDGMLTLRWQKKDGKMTYRLDHPAGYRVEVKNNAGSDLQRLP